MIDNYLSDMAPRDPVNNEGVRTFQAVRMVGVWHASLEYEVL